MAYTLSDVLQDVYEDLGQIHHSLATSGTTSTIVDTVQIGQHSDDDWKEGVAFITRADDAAPEGEFQRISAYVDNTGTFTVDTVFTVTPASGDTYAWASDYYPIRTMIELVNAGLRKLGDIVNVDTTTLDSAGNQTEYTAAVGWKRRRPLFIDIQGKTGDANDNKWRRIYNWEFIPAAPGSTGLIVFDNQLLSTRDIRVTYMGSHPTLTTYSSVISETIAPELAFAAALERAVSWQHTRLGGTNRFLFQKLNAVQIELNNARVLHPMWKPDKVAKLNIVGQRYVDVGEPDKVRLGHHHH